MANLRFLPILESTVFRSVLGSLDQMPPRRGGLVRLRKGKKQLWHGICLYSLYIIEDEHLHIASETIGTEFAPTIDITQYSKGDKK